MQLSVHDETSELKDVVVCFGEGIQEYKAHTSDEEEFTKYHKRSWDKQLLLKQQDRFFKELTKYGVRLHFPKTSPALIWQMYTRDTAFVVGDTLYYSRQRAFSEREGEIDALLELLTELAVMPSQLHELTSGQIEGGDVMMSRGGIYVGNGSRSQSQTVDELLDRVKGHKVVLGQNTMHLDTRLTLLPRKYALIYRPIFKESDRKELEAKFKLIDVLESELMDLGTNVLVVNPETIFSAAHNHRINRELKQAGFKVVEIDYTEPINLGGSFRCTTLPLVRS